MEHEPVNNLQPWENNSQTNFCMTFTPWSKFCSVISESCVFTWCNNGFLYLLCVNPHHVQSSYIIHTRRRQTEWIATTTGWYRRRGTGMSYLFLRKREKMLMCVWIMFGQRGDGRGVTTNLCISISAKASGAVSPVPLCCRSWPLISLRKMDEWKGHRFHEYLQYQFLFFFIRFMFTCMLLIQTVSLVNSSSLLKWD